MKIEEIAKAFEVFPPKLARDLADSRYIAAGLLLAGDVTHLVLHNEQAMRDARELGLLLGAADLLVASIEERGWVPYPLALVNAEHNAPIGVQMQASIPVPNLWAPVLVCMETGARWSLSFGDVCSWFEVLPDPVAPEPDVHPETTITITYGMADGKPRFLAHSEAFDLAAVGDSPGDALRALARQLDAFLSAKAWTTLLPDE